MNKQKWLAWAEVIDSWRVFPRLFLLSCFLWVVWLTSDLLDWYQQLPDTARGAEATGFASIVFLAAVSFLKVVYDSYTKYGRDWNSVPAVTQIAVTAVTTTTTPANP